VPVDGDFPDEGFDGVCCECVVVVVDNNVFCGREGGLVEGRGRVEETAAAEAVVRSDEGIKRRTRWVGNIVKF